jgi:hypothetical protein
MVAPSRGMVDVIRNEATLMRLQYIVHHERTANKFHGFSNGWRASVAVAFTLRGVMSRREVA